MARRIDTQKGKVYAAEDAAFPGHKCGPEPELRTVDDVERFIKAVCSRKRVQDRYPRAATYAHHFHVKSGAGTRVARGGDGMVNAPLWSRTRSIMLHELAHNLAGHAAAHNWRFTECYLFLVRQVMGRADADRLEAEYKARKVKYRKPRAKRPITADQRAVLVERLAAARAAKARGPEPEPATDWIDWVVVSEPTAN